MLMDLTEQMIRDQIRLKEALLTPCTKLSRVLTASQDLENKVERQEFLTKFSKINKDHRSKYRAPISYDPQWVEK
jgi:hypothetical protein